MSHDAAALHSLLGTRGTSGIGVTLKIAVFAGVGIDQAAYRAVVLCELRFHSAPALAVTR